MKNIVDVKAHTVVSNSSDETIDFGRKYAFNLKSGDIVALYGELGTGKTQIVKGICSAMGVGQVVNSPTFIIVNEYASGKMPVIYHFDLYRVKSEQEVIDIGFEDYLNAEGLILIEWPELIKDILPIKTKYIYISYNGNNENSRIIKI